MKRTASVLLAIALFSAASVFAEDNAACCAGMTAKETKGACSATFADLNLTAAQKTKMEMLAAECDKDGCNKDSMAKMEKSAKNVLNKEQFAAWKANCTGTMSPKA